MQNHIAGECQRENLSVALEVIESLRKLGYQIEEEAVRDGLDATRWAGRFTCLSEDPVVIVDGAHNEDAAKKLRTSIERYFTGEELILIMGVFKDKEYEKSHLFFARWQKVYILLVFQIRRGRFRQKSWQK